MIIYEDAGKVSTFEYCEVVGEGYFLGACRSDEHAVGDASSYLVGIRSFTTLVMWEQVFVATPHLVRLARA